MKLRLLLLIVICLAFCTGANAYYKQYTMTQGLISNTIYHSFRDSKGYMWFCSDKGVSKFDGKTFRHYSTLQGLTDNDVFNLYEDGLGRIWLFTFYGAPCYLKNDTVFTADNDPYLRRLPTISYPMCMLAENDTTVYIGYSTGQVFEIKGAKTRELVPAHLHNEVYAIYRSGNFIKIRSANALLTIEDDKVIDYKKTSLARGFKCGDKIIVTYPGRVELYQEHQLVFSANVNGLRLENVISCYSDDAGYVFIGTGKGLIILNYHTGKEMKLFVNNVVTSVDKDICGNYWVSTIGNGVYCLNKEFAQVRFVKEIDNDRLMRTHLGQIFLVSDSHLYNFHKNVLNEVKKSFHSSYEPLFLNDSLLIIASGTKTYFYNRYTKKQDIKNYYVKALYNFQSDRFLFITANFINNLVLSGGTLIYKDTTASRSRILTGAYAKKDGKVYLLSFNALYQFDPQNNECIKVDTIRGQPSSLFYINDKVIVSMNNQTALIYDPGKHFARTRVSTDHVVVNELYSLKNGDCLVRSNDGYYLWLLDTRNSKQVLRKIDLFKSSDVCMYPYEDSVLCKADNILCAFPQRLLYERYGSPILFVKKLILNHKEYSADKPIITKYGINSNVSIQLGSLYFNNSDNYFQYCVAKNGIVGEWIRSDGSNINIWLSDFGSYTIQLRVVTENGITSPVKTISIQLRPPFYNTLWFISAIVATVFIVIFAVVFLVFKKRRERLRNELHYMQLEHKAINSLLNPHFVFNAINNIQNLVNENEREQANEYLAMLSKLIRQNIENLRFDFISLEKELILVRNYVMLQNLRFNENVKLQINSSVSASNILIPPLLIHTFVENAIVHGYRSNIADFTIQIDLSISTDDYLVINIIDNGVGYNENNKNVQADKTSMGIEFTRKRLERLSDFYNVIHSVRINKRAEPGECGTEVVIILYSKFRAFVTVA
ncbi:MAG: histidine kinase [Bacteroidetes bacterium]|nr:histidine kinase [Bacteroidota bacterium]